MSESTQGIFFGIAFFLCLLAAFVPLRANQTLASIEVGWLGMASFILVFFVIALRAS